MKVALVNLTQEKAFSKNSSYQESLQYLTEDAIDYVDYCFDRETFKEQLEGPHEALRDPSVDIVWFVQGGFTLVRYLDHIDWELVRSSKKKFCGISDFTHFAHRAVLLGCECYYGASLNNILKWYPTPEKRKHITDFFHTGIVGEYKDILEIDLRNESVIGGHLMITTLMLGLHPIDLSNTYLFVEFHNTDADTFHDLGYYIDQLRYVVKENKPKGFIFGHSMLFNENKEMVDYKKINEFMISKVIDLNVLVYQMDHFSNLVKLSMK